MSIHQKKVWFILKGALTETKKEDSVSSQILDLFLYLGLVESLGNCYVDLLVMLLITNGRDFHIESRYSTPRIKHVISIDDLEKEKVPLTMKLNFLKDNGLENFADVVDSKLRNDITHLNFEIRKDDRIRIRGKLVGELATQCFNRFLVATGVVDKLLHNLAADIGWEKREESYIDDFLKFFDDLPETPQ